MGLDCIIDTVQIAKIVLVEGMLRAGGKMRSIVRGAIHRLQNEMHTDASPMEVEWRDIHESGQWLGSILQWSKKWKVSTGGKEWKRDTGRREGDTQIMDIMHGCPKTKRWCTGNNEWRLSGIMLESGEVRSDVPEDIRREIQKRADEMEETGEGKTRLYVQGPWNNMKAKAEAMRGWWVEKGTDRMEVKGVHRISGKWYVRGYAPKAKTRRCAPSTRVVWWKVKACSRQGDNTVEKGEVSRRIVEQQKGELASQDYWMDDENLKLRSEWMWRRHVDRKEAMMHVYSDGSVKYAREEGTWAWEAHIAERPDRPNSTALHLVVAGDGKEIRAPEATERVIRLGRAEPLALVAGLIALRAWKGSVAWYTDSQATIDTWNSLKYKSARKWASVDNKDVWRTLRRLKKEWGGRVNVIKVAAHQDPRKHDSCLTLHEVKSNIVDRQAERAYAKEASMPLEALDAPRTSVITIEGRECIGKTKATIMNHVKVEKVKQWMLEQERTRGDEELMWGRAINVAWDMMLETGRT
jgi:hypothetical protein